MTSTLVVIKTPKPRNIAEMVFKHPIKGCFGERYYGHDGSLSGDKLTIGTPEDLAWLQGLVSLSDKLDTSDKNDLAKMIEILKNGGTLDIWFD